jgi:hypothetical protein
MNPNNEPKPELLEVWYTTAPKAYDGGDVYELDTATGMYDTQEKPFRKIAIPPKSVEWQKGRNLSGMYPLLTLTEVRKLNGF